VDLESGKVNAAAELEGVLGRGVAYVLAIDTRDGVKDVTRRYAASHFMTQTRGRFTKKKQLFLSFHNFRQREQLAACKVLLMICVSFKYEQLQRFLAKFRREED